MDIGNPTHRRAPGQVAQTILIAIMVTIGDLDILEIWLYEPRPPARVTGGGSHASATARHLPSDLPDPIRRPSTTPNRHRTIPETTKIPPDLAIGRDLVTIPEPTQEQSLEVPEGNAPTLCCGHRPRRIRSRGAAYGDLTPTRR
ncbi:hypothetical protein [Streptomyces lavendulocolor]|uniref:hypothetical protein n=1 Tax=Streptomyces lavendulocolor TaxID=67316 RepID=UPI003C2C3FBF